MKKIVQIYFLTCIVLLTLAEATAQVNGSVSRLNIGKKKSASLIVVGKSSLLPAFQNGLDRSIKLRPSAAISAYYRSVAFGNINTTAPKARHNGVEATVAALPEIRQASNNGDDNGNKNDDYFFVNEKVKVKNAFPNPATDYAEIYYQIESSTENAKIIIYNAIFANVGEYELDTSERQLRLPTRQLPTGLYYYQLLLDGKKVATKKLLVRH